MKPSFLFLPAVAAAALVSSCEKNAVGDTTFAKNTFESLARGDLSVSDSIDWSTLNSLGNNIGATYVKIESAEEQRRFREAFITQFSAEFQNAGGKVEDFINWRIVTDDTTHTLVSAASPNKVLDVTVSKRDGIDRVSGLSIR